MDEIKPSFHEELSKKREEALKEIQKIENQPDRAQPMAYRTKAIIHMIAMGFSKKEVAKQMNLSPARIHHILSSSGAKAEIERIQKEFFFTDPQAMFKAMVPKAARTIRKLMIDPAEKGSTRLGAANTVLDRALGKAVQPIEHQGSAIKDLLLALDSNNRKKEVETEITEAVFKEISNNPQKDDLENWLDANL